MARLVMPPCGAQVRTFELLVFATQFLQVSHTFHPQNHVGRGWGIADGAMGAVRLPKILVLKY